MITFHTLGFLFFFAFASPPSPCAADRWEICESATETKRLWPCTNFLLVGWNLQPAPGSCWGSTATQTSWFSYGSKYTLSGPCLSWYSSRILFWYPFPWNPAWSISVCDFGSRFLKLALKLIVPILIGSILPTLSALFESLNIFWFAFTGLS